MIKGSINWTKSVRIVLMQIIVSGSVSTRTKIISIHSAHVTEYIIHSSSRKSAMFEMFALLRCACDDLTAVTF